MKKIGRFICFTTLFLLIAGCKQQKTIRYELVDGNPQIDYIDFLNDTLCRFVAPGPLVLTSHYTKKGDIYEDTKLLQKREMRKDIVIELSYKGFSRASDYS